MSDLLGGLLLGGLLGNLIISHACLNCSSFDVEVEEVVTQVYNSRASSYQEEIEKYLIIKIRIKNNEYLKRFKIRDFVASMSVKIINKINRMRNISCTVNIKEKHDIFCNIKVKHND